MDIIKLMDFLLPQAVQKAKMFNDSISVATEDNLFDFKLTQMLFICKRRALAEGYVISSYIDNEKGCAELRKEGKKIVIFKSFVPVKDKTQHCESLAVINAFWRVIELTEDMKNQA